MRDDFKQMEGREDGYYWMIPSLLRLTSKAKNEFLGAFLLPPRLRLAALILV